MPFLLTELLSKDLKQPGSLCSSCGIYQFEFDLRLAIIKKSMHFTAGIFSNFQQQINVLAYNTIRIFCHCVSSMLKDITFYFSLAQLGNCMCHVKH